MVDKRKHRGKGPRDAELFGEQHHAALREAARDLSMLLSRGYRDKSSLKLVGDRHALTERQRKAVLRCACADEALGRRRAHEQPAAALRDARVAIDGFNCLITLETALSGGLVLVGRDGCCRDLSSIHGTYRAVTETPRAIELLGEHLERAGVAGVDWLLDRPVSNSGRLKVRLAEVAERNGWSWNIELHFNPDRVLTELDAIVASSDAWVIDNCARWTNLLAAVLERDVVDAWTLPLS